MSDRYSQDLRHICPMARYNNESEFGLQWNNNINHPLYYVSKKLCFCANIATEFVFIHKLAAIS